MAGPPGYGFKDTWYPPPPTSEPPQCICHSNTFITRQQCPKCINSPTGTVHWKSPPLLYPSDPHHHYSDSINNPQFCNSNHGYTPQPYVVSKPPNAPPSMGGYKSYYWVDVHHPGGIPSTALLGGHDVDGDAIYVGRAFHENDWIPAKVVPNKQVAYVAYGGSEHELTQYQVLCEQRFDWLPSGGGNIPPGAVEGGRTADGESLFIGRVYHDGALSIGKVHPSHGVCYVPFDGKEVGHSNYEVLVLRS
ncbi:uncharacterized protein LOC115886738 [Sitophilus oryzae]|uniref:Uncharacterized protein LOC115886738 n=1 Tax=Sitophilus oryzae TaxID=7048 RepID=A0A6J2YG58_SITOR|nr:uncharacterized protein LOC115886738 [Sitophilus oryzae]